MNFVDAAFQSQNTNRREQPVHGIAIAIVTGRMGDGTYELKYLSMGGNAPSAPARMMMPSAGSKRGVYWMPEAGDEVVVAFEGSDSNSPVILGALYNSNSAPPDQAKPSNDNNVRTIVSRSGHEITLDDSPGAGKVTVKTNGGRSVTLDDTPPGNINMSTPSGISIELDDATGTLTLTAISIQLNAANLTMSGLNLSIQATAVDIEAAAAITMNSAVAITLTAPVSIALSTQPKPPGVVLINGAPF
jgi:phage baseplate assembly protein gpV